MSGYGRPPFNSTLLFKQPSLALRQVIQFADPDPTEATVQGNWFWGVTVDGIYPNSDVTTTGWSAVPPGPLYAVIDEVTPNDSDYIVSPNLAATPGPAVFGLNQSAAAGSYTVNVRAKYGLTAGQFRVSMLDSGGTSVGTSSWTAVTGAFTTYPISLTTTGTATQVKIEVQ
jgi:hypothetical protein